MAGWGLASHPSPYKFFRTSEPGRRVKVNVSGHEVVVTLTCLSAGGISSSNVSQYL